MEDVITQKLQEDVKAISLSLAGISKQHDVTIETTKQIIENYNQVVLSQNELATMINVINMDILLSKNILVQIKDFIDKTFPGYSKATNLQVVTQLMDLLIDSTEKGIENKKNFFEQARRNAEAQK